jgi:tetratricopeptide (TPR) repeat protein
VNRVNRTGLRPLALAAAALLFSTNGLLAQAVPAAGAPTSLLPPQQYDQCLALARSDPQRAFDQATAWRNLGGGFAAEHCAAVALIGQKKYADAATQLQTMAGAMMQADPGLRGGALEQAGSAWLLAGKATEAKLDFDAALSFLPNDPEILIDRAEAYALDKKFFEAVDDLNRVLEIAPKRSDALIYRASAYRQLDSLDLALDDVERALVLQPNAIPGLLERGNINRLKGNFASAKADWQRIQELAPSSPEAQAAKDNLTRLANDPAAQSAEHQAGR